MQRSPLETSRLHRPRRRGASPSLGSEPFTFSRPVRRGRRVRCATRGSVATLPISRSWRIQTASLPILMAPGPGRSQGLRTHAAAGPSYVPLDSESSVPESGPPPRRGGDPHLARDSPIGYALSSSTETIGAVTSQNARGSGALATGFGQAVHEETSPRRRTREAYVAQLFQLRVLESIIGPLRSRGAREGSRATRCCRRPCESKGDTQFTFEPP